MAVGPFWKQPGDTGPSGRKWKTALAFEEETITLLPARKAAAAKRRKTAAKAKAPGKKPAKRS